jgi:RHS repeat-associated protein
MASDTVSYSYANQLLSGVNVSAPNTSPLTQTFAYDATDRLTNIVSNVGVFSLLYTESNSRQNLRLAFPNGAYITNAYSSVARLLNTVLKDSANAVVDSHTYDYNIAGQRTNESRVEGSYVRYGYNAIGSLISAAGKEAGGVTNRLHEQFGYDYDAAGNLSKKTNNALVETFSVNSLNELTGIDSSGTLTVAGATRGAATDVLVNGAAAIRYGDNTFAAAGQPMTNSYTAIAQDAYGRSDTNIVTPNLLTNVVVSYDELGNLLSDGRRIFSWDDENRLTSLIVTNSVSASTRSDFVYDGLGRRRITFEYEWRDSDWVLVDQARYIYVGRRVIQERNEFNLPRVTYFWGNDLSGSAEGAGGIGGILGRIDHGSGITAYYHSDGAGNVTSLIDERSSVLARYLYDPFGKIVGQSGPLAEANIYRFSSKEFHQKSGLYYYGFRWYDPNLQRWINRDPIGEAGGVNLYQFARNNPLSFVDRDGLDVWVVTIPAFLGIPYQDLVGDDGAGGSYVLTFGPQGKGLNRICGPGNVECNPYSLLRPDQLSYNLKECNRVRTTPQTDRLLKQIAESLAKNTPRAPYTCWGANCWQFAWQFSGFAANLNNSGTLYPPPNLNRNLPPRIVIQ